MELVAGTGSVVARRVAPLATGCALAAAATYVALNDPAAAGSFFPQCAFHQLTGLWCPGCGLTRGMHALLGGDVPAALSFNVFTPVAAVLIVALWWSWTARAFGTSRPPRLARVPGTWWIAGAATLALYGILRNVPVAPLRSLAP